MKKLVYEFCYRLFGYSVFQKLYQPKVKEHLRILHPTMERVEIQAIIKTNVLLFMTIYLFNVVFLFWQKGIQ